MENNQILDKLIWDQENESWLSNNVPTWKDDEVLITTSRVVWVRYKFYTVILLLLISILWYNYILPAYQKYQTKQIELSNMELKIMSFEDKKTRYESNMWLVDKIKQVEPQVVTCVNTLQGCKELPDLIKNNFSVVRSYLLLSEINNEKMILDEKKILANIDWFLLKKDSLNSNSTTVNGILNKIAIWEKQKFNENLYFVPIELKITFSNKDWLLSFIDNVEKKIPIDPDLRLLYKIDKITYDIVNYDQPQDSSVYMYLYFYDHK